MVTTLRAGSTIVNSRQVMMGAGLGRHRAFAAHQAAGPPRRDTFDTTFDTIFDKTLVTTPVTTDTQGNTP